MTHKVPFITIDDEEPDLVVSFALGPKAERSLTLIRTPAYERLLDAHERGVSVRSGTTDGDRRNLLVAFHWLNDQAVVISEDQEFRLDLSAVPSEAIEESKAMLERMNFDRCFQMYAA